jgi:hypothetical protein
LFKESYCSSSTDLRAIKPGVFLRGKLVSYKQLKNKTV